MPEHEIVPQYRYRGSVCPSAEVSRPVAVHRHAARAEAGTAAGGAPKGSSATIDIFDVIDSWGGWWGISSHDVDRAMADIGDVDTLYVRINSPGGEASEGVAIANLLRAYPGDVRCTVYGMAASAASIIAVAGSTLSMGPGSTLMVHDASGFAYGDVVAMQAGLNMLNTMSDAYASLYALKAGGTAEQWRAIMRDTTWYTPDSAVAAKLADRVGLDPSLPGDLPDVEDETDDDGMLIEIDIELNPAARAVARRADLTLLPAAAARAPETPATGPVAPSTDPKEADAMSDTLLDGLRKQLGLSDDADEATVLAANAEALNEKAEPEPAPAPEAKIPAGMTLVDSQQWEDVKAMAAKGATAAARQSAEDRDATIAKAIDDGKLSRNQENVAKLKADWDADPELTAKRIADMAVLYPVTKTPTGYAGGEDATAGDVPFTEEQAKAQAAQLGVDYKELMSA